MALHQVSTAAYPQMDVLDLCDRGLLRDLLYAAPEKGIRALQHGEVPLQVCQALQLPRTALPRRYPVPFPPAGKLG